jgi:hypothetical protein
VRPDQSYNRNTERKSRYGNKASPNTKQQALSTQALLGQGPYRGHISGFRFHGMIQNIH